MGGAETRPCVQNWRQTFVSTSATIVQIEAKICEQSGTAAAIQEQQEEQAAVWTKTKIWRSTRIRWRTKRLRKCAKLFGTIQIRLFLFTPFSLSFFYFMLCPHISSFFMRYQSLPKVHSFFFNSLRSSLHFLC